MNKKTKEMLKYLKLNYLYDHWDDVIKNAEESNLSYNKFLTSIVKKEYDFRVDIAKVNRIKRAKIPNEYVIDTYPFNEQPHLNKKRLLERYDSLDYLVNNRNLVFIGPSGTGKTGLASSILRRSVEVGYSGRFVSFNDLMEELLASIADQSSKRIIKKYSNYSCLLIDDLTYFESDKAEVGLFYSLIQKRYKRNCTIVTSSLGFGSWNKIFNHKELTDALIGRLSDNGHIINLKKCKNIRKNPDVD